MKTRKCIVSSKKYEDFDDCLTAAARDFVRRRHVAMWRVSAQWGDTDRETIEITY